MGLACWHGVGMGLVWGRMGPPGVGMGPHGVGMGSHGVGMGRMGPRGDEPTGPLGCSLGPFPFASAIKCHQKSTCNSAGSSVGSLTPT
jgi:hypothetical protein